MAHGRRTRGFSRGPSSHRRLNEWVAPPLQEYIAVASAGATIISQMNIEEATTIVRTRGMVSIKPQAFSADLSTVGAFGVGVVSAEALTIGTTAIPEPYSDADWGGWLMWESFAYHFEVQSAVGTQFPASIQINVDSKGMRKVGSNEALVFVAESFTGAFEIAECTRQLFKLS